MPKAPVANWADLREEWLERNLEGAPINLADFAREKGLKESTLMNRARTEKWVAELQVRRANLNTATKTALVEASAAMNTELEFFRKYQGRVQEKIATDEVETRLRHASIARGVIQMALEGLGRLQMDNLKPRELIELLKLGLNEEREALGIVGSQTLTVLLGEKDQGDSDTHAMAELLKAVRAFQRPVAIEGSPTDSEVMDA